MILSALRAQFSALVNRTDLTTALADSFLDSGVRKLERILRVPTQEKSFSYTADGTSRDFLIPNDYLELIGLYWNGALLTRVSGSMPGGGSVGTPTRYWRYGNIFRLDPIPEVGTLEILYYSEFEDFQGETYETYEMSIYPDAIIYAALLYAADFFVDDRLGAWQARFDNIVAEITQSAERDEFAGRDLRIESPHPGVDY